MSRKHGLYSEREKDDPQLLVELKARADLVASELAGPGGLTTIHGDVVRRYVEATALLDGLAGHLMRDGVLGKGGRTRASFKAYVALLDRHRALAQMLGLQRQQKPTATIDDFLDGRTPKGPTA